MSVQADLEARANPNVGDYRTRYPLPIHWLFARDQQFGMEYFGYIDIVRDLLKSRMPKGSLVYDIGCGDGRMSADLIADGARVHGFDYSPSAVAFARIINPNGAFDTSDLTQTDPFNAFPEERPQAMVMIEVLEHLHPRFYPNLLKTFRSRLAPNGTFIVSVPSADLPLNKQWHYVHFKENEFETLLTENGWDIQERIYNFRLSHPCAWIVRHGWRWLDNKYWRLNGLCRLVGRWYLRACNRCMREQKPARFIFVCRPKA